jgi:hypothetical protein
MTDDAESCLRTIARSVQGDWMLSRLAWLADKGLRLSITMVIPNGLLARVTMPTTLD